MINYISHKKSKQIVNGLPKLPEANQLKEGEIAINYANGYETLSIKNSDNEITTFSSTEQIEKYVDTKLGSGFTGENSANTVTSVIEKNEKIAASALNDLNDRKLDASAYTPTDLSDYYKKEETSGKTELDTAFGLKANTSDLTTHTGDKTVHITSDERTKWNGKISNAQYNKTDKKIYFYSGATTETPISNIDATDFIKDGMVSNVEIKDVTNSGSCLVITFNADAGKQDITIPVTKIFNPANYYLKSETSGKTEIAAALDSKANTSDLSNYYKKNETSGKTELDTAFGLKANASDLATKANTSDLTAHTGNSSIHITSDERTKWDDASTTLASHTGDSTVHITTDERTKWNNAATSSHTHANKAVLDTITAIDTELNETSNNLVVNSAITKVIEDNEKITSASLNDLNDRKLDASAYTPTDLSDYYKKEETSGKTELNTAFALKANASDLATHISDNIKHITSDERTKWDNATTTLATHTGNSTVHITADERAKWNGKISNAQYSSSDKKIFFYSGATSETPVSTIDATDFIKDGMVSNVEVKDVANSGTCLVITFNADAGNQVITIPVSKIFDSGKYYLKTETSGKTEISDALSLKADTSALTAHTGNNDIHITSDERTKWDNAATNSHTHANKDVLDKITAIDTELSKTSNNLVVNSAITKVIVDNEKIVSASLNDLNDRKLDASAYTPTDLSDYYKKEETSAKTELTTAFNSKANSADLTTHTGNSAIHITADERSKWNEKISNVQYNNNSIKFYSGATTEAPVSTIDVTPFIKDGMVSNVEIKNVASSGSCLVITFNTDANKQDINIPVSEIFNPANYYLKTDTSGKTEISTALNEKTNKSDLTAHTGDGTIHVTSDDKTKWNNAYNEKHIHANKDVLDTITAIDSELNAESKNLVVNSAITKVIVDNEKIVSASLNDLNDRKLDASAYTPTDLSDYYKKEETSGKTEITNALNAKANTDHTHTSNDITDKVTEITVSNSGSTSVPTVSAVMQKLNELNATITQLQTTVQDYKTRIEALEGKNSNNASQS